MMYRLFAIFLISLFTSFSFGQKNLKIEVNKEYPNIDFTDELTYNIVLEKGEVYIFSILQIGIDVEIFLMDFSKNKILRKDTPNGQNGLEKFEYLATTNNTFYLKIKRLEESGNSYKGKITIEVNNLVGEEKEYRKMIIEELAPENLKTVQTIDIDHFWEAFDYLKNCKTYNDSVAAFQKLYIDRATDGLKDFIPIAEISAENIVETIAIVPKFYNSVRENTLKVKNAVPIIEKIVEKFEAIYPNFTPHKVTFVIGVLNSGGTVSEDFLLIGSEIVAATDKTDLSELPSEAFKAQLSSSKNVEKRIENFIAHEYVHTQQPAATYAKDAIRCELLHRAMREGFCDFIGELLTGSQINLVALEYGNKHEATLWQEFKNELCNMNPENWFYNYSTVIDKPADLGYYIGYKIAENCRSLL